MKRLHTIKVWLGLVGNSLSCKIEQLFSYLQYASNVFLYCTFFFVVFALYVSILETVNWNEWKKYIIPRFIDSFPFFF